MNSVISLVNSLLTSISGAPLSLQLLTFAIGLFGSACLYVANVVLVKPLLSPLRNVPGPARDSWLAGNLKVVFDQEPGVPHLNWARKFGSVFKYHGLFGQADRLVFTDPVALNHVLLTKSYDYPKPNAVRANLTRILGKGILFAEGKDHQRQKRIMNPAFSPSHLRAIAPIFFSKSYKLREKWIELISSDTSEVSAFKDEESAKAYSDEKREGEIVFDVSPWLSKVTLDIIGVAGFGYEFDSLDGKENKLGNAFNGMLTGGNSKMTAGKMLIGSMLGPIINHAPWIVNLLPSERFKQVRKGFLTIDEESRKILDGKRADLKNGGLESVGGGKDLITLLLKANMADAKSQMTDSELQGQMTTFLLAGHETTSTSLTWTLWTLAQNPHIQDKLRAEIRAARQKAAGEGRMELESDELNSLVYLDAVCREILRLESPVSNTIRAAAKDDTIPLSKPLKLLNGTTTTSISVKAGQVIFLSINSVNQDPAVFGDDAGVFRPERWIDDKVGENKEGPAIGVYSHMLTFLAGPRACIGYKFAILELKAILSVLIDDFEFSEREPGLKLERRSAIVMRPYILGEEDRGPRMPLRVSLAKKG